MITKIGNEIIGSIRFDPKNGYKYDETRTSIDAFNNWYRQSKFYKEDRKQKVPINIPGTTDQTTRIIPPWAVLTPLRARLPNKPCPT